MGNGRLIINSTMCAGDQENRNSDKQFPTVDESCFRSRHPSQSYSDGEEKEQPGEIFALNMELYKLIYF